MLKLLGSLCILGGGAAAVVQRLRDRRQMLSRLRVLIGGLERLGWEIRLNRTPLPRALRRAGESGGAAAVFFGAVADDLCAGGDLASAWRRSAAAAGLDGGDRPALEEAGDGLRGDEEIACKAIDLARSRLDKSLGEKLAAQAEEERRTTALGLCAAALAVILLI